MARITTRTLAQPRLPGVLLHLPGRATGPVAPAEREPFSPALYLAGAAFVIAALLAGLILQRYLKVSNVSLIFLIAVLASAVTGGLGPSLLACLLGVLAFNFFFLPPLYTFTITEPDNIVALVVFAVAAVIASNLTARIRRQAVVAWQQQKMTEALYAFSRKLAGIGKLDDLLRTTAFQMASMLKGEVVLLLPEGDGVRLRMGCPPETQWREGDLAAARAAWENRRPTGRGADAPCATRWLFVPLSTDGGAVGVVGIHHGREDRSLSTEERRLLDALADQTAVAIARINLADGIEEARVEAETERLRAALLVSISHDLRTPLASILGAATSLRTYGRSYGEAVREDLVATVHEEAERLNRFVGNLLDMTRLESGAVESTRGPVDLAEVVGTALRRVDAVLDRHKIEVDLAPDLPMLYLDYLLLDQVLFNLLDNAAKYAPPGTLVRIAARRDGNHVALDVLDEGPGIPPGDIDRVFDKFYRVRAQDRQRAGTGLGLAICRGFRAAMGGTIAARNRSDRPGAVFSLALPIEAGGASDHGATIDE
jgi:two-component system sensor histidine kinase KdpD